MRKYVLGIFLAVTLMVTAPALAAEEPLFEWPGFDLVGWVIELWESFGSESAEGAQMGHGYEPWGLAEPPAEIGPGYEPYGSAAPATDSRQDTSRFADPTADIGPAIDPGG